MTSVRALRRHAEL